MDAPEHRRAAEECLASAEEEQLVSVKTLELQRALVHAVLALRDEKPIAIFSTAEEAQWHAAAVEYIDLLQDACGRSAGSLIVRGWGESEAVIQRGRELRAILGIKGAGE